MFNPGLDLDLCFSDGVTTFFFHSGLPTSRQHGHRPSHAALWLPEAFLHQRLLVTTLCLCVEHLWSAGVEGVVMGTCANAPPPACDACFHQD